MTIRSLVPVKFSTELLLWLHQPVGDTTLDIAIPTTPGRFPMRVTPIIGCHLLLLTDARRWTHCQMICSECFFPRSMSPILPFNLKEDKTKQPALAHSLSISRA